MTESEASKLMTETRASSVAILLCTWNGAAFLPAQLASIAAQTWGNWRLLASDDGSTDGTLAQLEAFRAEHGAEKVQLLRGPGKGYAANFMSVLRAAAGQAEYFAFCDQDDVWDADKLQRAIEVLQRWPEKKPALYCGRSRLIDMEGRACGLSMYFGRPPSFRNALVQSLAGANTMVVNAAAMRLLAATPDDQPVVSHDWWAYLLVTGAGGHVYYDQQPSISYRQHGSNVIGAALGWRQRWRRFGQMLGGSYRRWNDINLPALTAMESWLSAESAASLRAYRQLRESGLFGRLVGFYRMHLYRQTRAGDLGFWCAVLLGRL
ncbi:glycosyltransferase family 2 protein [Frateuria aurantia]|nr:glycosyltransferase family 2 protein [Frateuria aurantia]